MGERDDLREELRLLAGAVKNHVRADRDSCNPVSRFRVTGGLSSGSATETGGMRRGSAERKQSPRERIIGLDDVRAELGDCTRCPLHRTRKNIVFGEGISTAKLVFVGEAPGEEEDNQGRPFVGRAGQLLTRIILAMKLRREDVYICNILKCRPPGNRNPKEEEITTCEPFLMRQIEAINPEVVCALGTFAAKTLLRTDVPISAIRGKFQDFRGRKLMPTYHPAYLLRNPDAKKLVWEDVQKIMKIL